jgi:glycosyltransferase involved in cell wall biosynthesis
MSLLKVMMVNTPQSPRFKGGDTTQMRKTAAVLRQVGVHVIENTDVEPNARGFDVAHVFNLRTIGDTARQVQSLIRSGVPVVLSPIYLNPGVALWANRVISNIFMSPRSDAEIAALIEEFRTRRLKITTPEGEVISAQSPNRGRPDYDQLERDILANVSHLAPNSVLEHDSMVKTLGVSNLPFTVVPYAADPREFLDPDPLPFVQKYGVKDFVLQVGRIEASKNQLMMVYALRNSGLPVVLVGQTLQQNYLDMCIKYGPPDLKVIPHLPTEELRHAYAAARVHVLPSWIETCGLVTMEAALANSNVVCSTASYEVEFFRDYAYYCDPADPDSIRQAVINAYENYPSDESRRAGLKQWLLQEYTWEKAAFACLRAYRRTLQNRG